MSKITRLLMAVSGGFWFTPSLVAIALGGLAFLTLEYDISTGDGAAHLFGPSLRLSIDGARTVLSTIAAGMMTVASIVFSLTFVALTTMSSQLGPRILLFFMHDRATQVVLGAFIGTFLFSLIVLLSAGGQEHGFVPRISLGVAVLLAVVAFGLMIYFVHHIAASIQADVLVARLGGQLVEAVDKLEAQAGGERCATLPSPFDAAERGDVMAAPASGYVQFVDWETLADIAAEAGVAIELLFVPADFLVEGAPMARVIGELGDARSRVIETITLGPQRTPAQQAHFELSALTEMAVRALSPGVNDPFTAISCVDRLVDGLAHIARKRVARRIVHRRGGRAVLAVRRRDFADYLDAAFAPIRAHAREDALVMSRVVWGYGVLEGLIEGERERRALREALQNLRAEIEAHIPSESDRGDLLERSGRALRALDGDGGREAQTDEAASVDAAAPQA